MILQLMGRLIRDERGQGMTEYGLILALIAIVVIGALTLLGGSIKTKFTDIKNTIESASTTP